MKIDRDSGVRHTASGSGAHQASSIRAVAYEERWLKLSYDWLHDEELRELMRPSPFTAEDQKKWFEGLSERSDYRIWGVEYDGCPVGAFGLKSIDGTASEYWGYIGEKQYWGRGIGRWMVTEALASARELGLKRVFLKVVSGNTRAVRLYESFGFTIQRIEEDLYWMEYFFQ